MASIDASRAITAAAAYLPIAQNYGPRQPTASAPVSAPTSAVDTVDLSPEGKTALEAVLAASQPSSPAQHAKVLSTAAAVARLPFDIPAQTALHGSGAEATVVSAPKADRPASNGGDTQNAELLAEATLIGGLLDSNEEEEELLFR